MSGQLTLTLEQDKRSYKPGETVCGEVQYTADKKPRRIAVSLEFRTEGRGSTDKGSCAEIDLETMQQSGTLPFQLRIPDEIAPSYHGKLIALCYRVEARLDLAFARDPKDTVSVVISPTGEPLSPDLDSVESTDK